MNDMVERIADLQADVKQRAKFERYLASIGDGVIVVDTKLHVVAINKAALQFFHKRKASVIGKGYWRFFRVRSETGKRAEDIVRKALRKVLHKGKKSRRVTPEALQRVFVRIAGEGMRPVAVSVSVFHSPSGTVRGGVISFRDIAEEVEVDRMKTEFVSFAAHQLRTPLTSLRWNIETMLSGEAGKLSKLQHGILADMYAANSRMLQLVNDLLNIARLEEGRVSVEPEAVDLKAFIRSIMKPLELLAKDRAVKMEFAVDKTVKGSPTVSIDQLLVHQVLHNFVTNALKYSKDKNGQVRVTLSQERFYYRISVWDNGIGVPAKDKSKIFQKFYRSDNAAAADPLGTGLGLYIGKMLVRLSGGKIGFESNERDGTTFYFTIPISGSKKYKRGKKYSALNL